MINKDIKKQLIELSTLSANYCAVVENVLNYDKTEFINQVLNLLPRLYVGFLAINVDDIPDSINEGYYAEYVDEARYDEVKQNIGSLIGEDDVYLETFQEDMKYSEHPVAATISESLADIFQPLYNFVGIVVDLGEDEIEGAGKECVEQFARYWSQILCNVMRALNEIKYRE